MYLMYLDESGHSRLDNPGIREQSNFFVLGGLIIKEEFYEEINKKFKEFKKANFPEEIINIPLHAVDLNNISRSSKNPYKSKISDEKGKELLKLSYEFISTLQIEAIAIIIDNYNLKNQYKYPKNPYTLSYEFVIEKFQRIILKKNEQQNCLGRINIAKCSNKLNYNLKEIHNKVMIEGTKYVKDYSNILNQLNIEEPNSSSFYEIADLICYAYQRAYYVWLCENLGRKCTNEEYIKIINPICTPGIGNKLLWGAKVKIFPEPRFFKKKAK